MSKVVLLSIAAIVMSVLSIAYMSHAVNECQQRQQQQSATPAQVMSPAQQQELQQQQHAFYGAGSMSIPSAGSNQIHPGQPVVPAMH